jgi:aldose 1-epimerase
MAEDLTMTGRLESTARHGNGFQQARRIGNALPLLFKQHGDLYSLPRHGTGEMVRAARLEDPVSGRVLISSTTERYLQFYTGSHLDGAHAGKSGKAYSRFAGVCLECEGYPDAANATMRKDILIYPGQTQRHATASAFSVSGAESP